MIRVPRDLPRRVLLAAGFALAAVFATRSPESFELSRVALAAGEWWRLATYALVHASAAHAWLDIGALVALVLGFGLSRRAAWFAIVGTPLIGIGTLVAHPEFASTCGLSGLLHGLFVLTAIEQFARTNGVRRSAFLGAAVAVTLKAWYEVSSGTPIFTDANELGAPIAFAAHGIGALLGWSFALTARRAAPDRAHRRAPATGPPARCTVSCAGSHSSPRVHTRS